MELPSKTVILNQFPAQSICPKIGFPSFSLPFCNLAAKFSQVVEGEVRRPLLLSLVVAQKLKESKITEQDSLLSVYYSVYECPFQMISPIFSGCLFHRHWVEFLLLRRLYSCFCYGGSTIAFATAVQY